MDMNPLDNQYYHTQAGAGGSDSKAPSWFIGLMGISALCVMGPLAWILLSVSVKILFNAL